MKIMGWVQHDAIIVTSYVDEIGPHWMKAKEIFPRQMVSILSPLASNNYCSFIIWPDGSGVSFKTSLSMDKLREEFIAYLVKQNCYYIHVSFGELGIHCARDTWKLPNEEERMP